ncbi:glycosyltransferase family 2 protein [Tuwongella immobilis]|uniref:Glycosyltransferase 2-like domain-containing protein n=1 Tax=Tuwongella immobilis TaxID=692036 RepID=A0A6C2YLN4_9BACT|nr:glycosyltransferase family 2 protein [Tuwongella immobilis]VIP02005.1 glycosyl transferase family 2 : Dolichol-phosphate mannosyltransferase OS=Blastopirellula marina DSM 3645 GN=DSM3645_04225 PE=4 SV=1: Glycos_transf_2 [Tuwongella immobilis]VTS00102.1 glycosyl transferase family 2 : Dolichol-phosphate mannosyltransferase OS=Blastopirellula marina DSM 3645 GN=DSM3645_04225 PE=4 SV=1: Glycos_transf_2 [Tuwongella immobilis]
MNTVADSQSSALASTGMVSLVVPVYNEVESLHILVGEIREVMTQLQRPFEVIFVDDGSRDGSWSAIQKLAAEQPEIRAIRFRRNFGKAAALQAGFRMVRGEVALTLDADLQDDPHEIPRFLELLNEGYDVISGWKKVRHDPWHKVFPSRVFNGMISTLTGVKLHDHNCGMKCYRAEVLKEVRLYGELHRFIPVLAAAKGYRVGEMVINHRARKYGHSKYGVRRFIKGFLDLLTVSFITSFGRRPQHMLGSLGLGSFALGLLGMTYLAITWVIRWFQPDAAIEPLHNRPLLSYSLTALLFGAQLFLFGLIAEMLVVTQSKDEDSFSIAETLDSLPSRPVAHDARL